MKITWQQKDREGEDTTEWVVPGYPLRIVRYNWNKAASYTVYLDTLPMRCVAEFDTLARAKAYAKRNYIGGGAR
jgi:hypothetical protein